jgi:methylated-DNA-[protein]-cysteine S-methyltransferase
MENPGMTTMFTYYNSPVGPLLLMSDGRALTGLHTDSDKHRPPLQPDWLRNDDTVPFAQVRAQLDAYFSGERTEFELPLAPHGTEFQQKVWRTLLGIPFGETISYAELARRIGQPQASRAVGHANSRNPISIIVPCHRVIGADRSLTGYAGGLERKRALLAPEHFEQARRMRRLAQAGMIVRRRFGKPFHCLGRIEHA